MKTGNENARGANQDEVEWLEVAMPRFSAPANNEGYEIRWRSGASLKVPRGFCVEEVGLLVELLRDGDLGQ